MIFGNIDNLAEYDFLPEKVQKCFAYAREHDLLSCGKGSHEIEGQELFFNRAEYMTAGTEERFWEAHRAYLDVHLILSGTERIDLNFIGNLSAGKYVAKDDFLTLEGEKNASVTLRPGDFLICYPGDGHMTGVQAGEPQLVKKVIFKVKI
ncbi:YhcH/YjgK/YiaL family protein [Anaerovibrio sp.]|uniref:YhcH/YjgK/YiaL family protein n=1 Tax=Anaerovibrio sp. TaxID=1872532 RepID=UPI003F15D73A